MAENPDWVPHDIDTTVPNAARVYDYWLDGAHNFAADREMANKVQQVVPAARDAVRIQRSFLRRVVLFLVEPVSAASRDRRSYRRSRNVSAKAAPMP